MSFRVLALLVPVEHHALASELAARFDPDAGGSDAFNLAFSATGQAPASHRGTQALFSEAGRSQLLALNQGAPLPPALIAGLDAEAARAAVLALVIGDDIELLSLTVQHGLQLIEDAI